MLTIVKFSLRNPRIYALIISVVYLIGAIVANALFEDQAFYLYTIAFMCIFLPFEISLFNKISNTLNQTTY